MPAQLLAAGIIILVILIFILVFYAGFTSIYYSSGTFYLKSDGNKTIIITYNKNTNDIGITIVNDTIDHVLQNITKNSCKFIIIKYKNGFDYSVDYYCPRYDNMTIPLVK